MEDKRPAHKIGRTKEELLSFLERIILEFKAHFGRLPETFFIREMASEILEEKLAKYFRARLEHFPIEDLTELVKIMLVEDGIVAERGPLADPPKPQSKKPKGLKGG